MVIVDRLIKYAYIILTTKTITAEQIANILLRYMVANHRIPSKIISNRDKLFISNI
jgi:antitoxin component of RelBE/YafQ-DinJ toxin-antitoxin module